MNILVLGYGNMGKAISSSIASQHEVYIVDPVCATQDTIDPQLTLFTDLAEASSNINSEINLIIIAVKPQVIAPVLKELKGYLSHTSYVISCVAGTSIQYLQSQLHNSDTHIARIMPTIAAKKKESFTGLTFSSRFPIEKRKECKELLENFGDVLEVSEELISAITAVSGSGIAFVAKFIEALTLAGVREGLSYPQSYRACLQTVTGAVSMLNDKEFDTPSSFIKSVCSPAGTSIEGIHALEQHGFSASIFEAVKKAREKSDFLSHST